MVMGLLYWVFDSLYRMLITSPFIKSRLPEHANSISGEI